MLSPHKETLYLNAYLRPNNSTSQSYLRRYWIEGLTLAVSSAMSLHHHGFTYAAANELILFSLVIFLTALSRQSGRTKTPRRVLESFLGDILNASKLTQPRPRKLQIKTAAKLRCAYCHDALHPSLASTCPECHTQVHEECCHEIDACPTFGCTNTELSSPGSRVLT